MAVLEMLRAHPQAVDKGAFGQCIEECTDCAAVCLACADACLAEDGVEDLVRCIRLNLDCADVCAATGTALTRQTKVDAKLVRALAQAGVVACSRFAEECERHAEHREHCRVCAAEQCRTCQKACEDVLSNFTT